MGQYIFDNIPYFLQLDTEGITRSKGTLKYNGEVYDVDIARYPFFEDHEGTVNQWQYIRIHKNETLYGVYYSSMLLVRKDEPSPTQIVHSLIKEHKDNTEDIIQNIALGSISKQCHKDLWDSNVSADSIFFKQYSRSYGNTLVRVDDVDQINQIKMLIFYIAKWNDD